MSHKKPSLHDSERPQRKFSGQFTLPPYQFFSELGKVSKTRLEKINEALIKHLDVNQWKNSSSVIEWFKGIGNKKDYLYKI